jgi:hypothetical protein
LSAHREVDITDDRFRSEVYLSDGGGYDNLGLELGYPRRERLYERVQLGFRMRAIDPTGKRVRRTRKSGHGGKPLGPAYPLRAAGYFANAPKGLLYLPIAA